MLCELRMAYGESVGQEEDHGIDGGSEPATEDHITTDQGVEVDNLTSQNMVHDKTTNVVQNLIDHHETQCADNTMGFEEQKQQEADHNITTPERSIVCPGVSEILPSLFLCGAGAARVDILERLGMNLVVNVAPELPNTPLPNRKPIYLRIPVLDKGDVDLLRFFDETCDLMEDVRQSGGRTLVHCVAGVSRSTTICIAYLMKYGAMTLKEAFAHVKRIRPQIRPNVGFFRQLMTYESILRGGSTTVSMVFVEAIGQEIPDVYQPEYKAMELFYQRHRRHIRRRD